MSDENWNTLCPEYQAGNASAWTVWDSSVDDLTFCYQEIFSAIAHSVFLVVNTFYISEEVRNIPQDAFSNQLVTSASWILRLLVSCSTLLLAILSVCLQLFWLEDLSAYGLISYVNFAVMLFSWLVQSFIASIMIKSRRPHVDTITICLSWFPIFLVFCLNLRSVLLGHYANVVHRIITMVIFGCQFVYLLSAGLQVFSSCLFFGPRFYQAGSASPDRTRLLHEMCDGQPVPKLGMAKLSGFFRQMLFLWVDPLMRYGAAGRLRDADDLFELPANLKADQHAESLKAQLLKDDKMSRFYLPKILFRLWGFQWLVLGAMKFTFSFLQYTSPLLVSALISEIENPDTQAGYYGYIYGCGLIVVNFLSAFIQLHYAFFVEKLALRIRGAMIDTVFGKLLKVHSSALSDSIVSGQVINLVGTDCQKVSENCQYLHQMWALPLQIGVALYLLHRQVGFAFIGGLIFSVLLVPLNQFLASKISTQVEENLKQRDMRVKLMGEALSAIRVIKFHAWEKWFCKRVGSVRIDEMKTVKTIKYLDAWCVYFWATTPLIMAVLTFTTYVLMGNLLTAAKVFTCLSVFGLVIIPLNAVPWIITGTVEAWISAKRLQTFLKISEIDLDTYYDLNENSKNLLICNGVFSWTKEPASHQLEDINLSLKKGHLVGVIGRVGSGKSSLLSAVMAEIYRISGMVEIPQGLFSNGFGYVPQDNWIQEGTISSNILFGSEKDPELYRQVISACALSEDLKDFSAGDLTQIGENGVTLSGGQQARIALARAVYQNKDIILMDDPLSAVDAQVANHIFDNCIVKLLADKTRILVTHHINFLRAADLVVLLRDGRISECGPPSEVLSRLQSSEFETGTTSQSEAESDCEDGIIEKKNKSQVAVRKRSKSGQHQPKDQIPQLISEEQREFGTIKLGVWKKYWEAVGNFWGVAVFLALVLMQASYNATDWWLSYWVAHEKTFINPITNKTESDYKFYLSVYGGIGGVNSFFAFVRSFVFAFAGIQAAYRMHDQLLLRVMRGKLSFFDTTPSGRILNRFAKDVTSVDVQLPFVLNILLACVFQLLGTLVIICYGLPWFSLVLLPIAPLYYFIQRFYRSTSREIKRINTLTQSPIYTMYSETVHGLSTIRAMRANPFFYSKYKKLLDDYLRAQFAEMAVNKWLTIRLQLLGMVIIAAVVLIALMIKADAGVLGLTVSYSLTVIGILNNFVTSLTETEKEMVSVERITQYLEDIKEESYDGILEPPANWPVHGAVEFKNISLKYRDDLPDALSGVTLKIKPGERLGIIGRTGAGKSSFMTTLFRTTEIYKGEIIIDGVDIHLLPLEQLRSRLALIPQSPSIFDASIRANMDPLNLHTEEELWHVIEMCHLRPVVEKLGGHLDVNLGENGRKLSLGQKQLVCLARVLLTKAKIICMDEATASVDYETDALIQKTLREAFSSSTLITIAHRLQTVMDYDRIVVMGSGVIVECDNPEVLLSIPDSLFTTMYQQSKRVCE